MMPVRPASSVTRSHRPTSPVGRLARLLLRSGSRSASGSAAALILLVATPAYAATYYVRADGSDGNDGLANAASGAWQTIDHAADSVSPGDVVRVQAGTYAERVTPAVNGIAGSPVTFVADGAVTLCGWDFNDSAHIRVVGFALDAAAGSCTVASGCVQVSGDANTHLELWNNTFSNATYNGIRVGLADRYDHCVVVGNTFHDFGINNGSGTAIATRGSNNLIAYNEIYNSAPDAFAVFGAHNRWIGNYVHDLNEDYGGHADGFQTGSSAEGWAYNLFESNTQMGVGTLGDEHVAQLSNAQSENCGGACGQMTENIFRRNVWHNISQGTVGINQTDDGPITFTRYYHNTNVESCESSNARYSIAWYGTLTSDSFIHDNIEVEGWGNDVSADLEVFYVTGSLACDYNLAFDPDGSVTFAAPFSAQAHGQPNVDPAFVDYAGDDFHLGASSGAIDHGGPLTTTSGSGTGTTFQVAAGGGGFFRGDDASLDQYGGELVVGDTLTVGDDVVVVASVEADAITVTEPFTWTDGEAVAFGDDPIPDIGAYPYKPGGYGIAASYSAEGGVVTVVAADPSLVRMVVVFEDGIPVGVDSTSPYSVAGVGSGTLDVRVYPLYASTTMYVAATEGAAGAGGSGGAVASGGHGPEGGGGSSSAGAGTGVLPQAGASSDEGGCDCTLAQRGRRAGGGWAHEASVLLGLAALGRRRGGPRSIRAGRCNPGPPSLGQGRGSPLV